MYVPGRRVITRTCESARNHGQRLAVSSHPPAARAGCGLAFTAGCGMRMGCCVEVGVARVGLLTSVPESFSSESKGAATRSASTSFSSLANSSSFCLRTSYTFFIRWHLRKAMEIFHELYAPPRLLSRKKRLTCDRCFNRCFFSGECSGSR